MSSPLLGNLFVIAILVASVEGFVGPTAAERSIPIGQAYCRSADGCRSDWPKSFIIQRNSKAEDCEEEREDEFSEEDDDMIPLGSLSEDEDVAASDKAEEEDDDDEEKDDDYVLIATKIPTADSPRWEIGNDFEHFLTQCTIQSFLFLLKTCRDPQTVMWVERFAQPAISSKLKAINASQALPSGGSGDSKLLSYHGLAAMNTTAFPSWDTFFANLLEQPQESFLIESQQAHVPSYELEINPPSLCSRMISVREQIAREFAKDLTVLAELGGQTLEAYWQGIRNAPLESNNLRGSGAQLPSLLFLESDPNPNEESDYHYAPSPLRKGNFDLLALLATQESIHRILNGPTSSSSSSNDDDDDDSEPLSQSNRSFLSNFYLNRLVSHFTGRQRYGRADQFLQELLLSTPSLVVDEKSTNKSDNGDGDHNGNKDSASLVDPISIAEQLLLKRQKVAMEWAEIAANVPNSHMEIKRLQLDLLMKSYDMEEDAFQ